jgi:hypothetical protein
MARDQGRGRPVAAEVAAGEAQVKPLDEELAYEYLQCRAEGTVGDRMQYWHWLRRTQPVGVYKKVAARVKEQDQDVLRVQQRLLKEGW